VCRDQYFAQKKLHIVTREQDKVRHEIRLKDENTRRLGEETTRVTEEKKEAERVNRKLKQAMEEYRVPQVGFDM
jgi:hypothetical protein